MHLTPDTLLQGGKYKIVHFISSGGFGNTYEGIHTLMDTRVAIKEFFPKMFCDRDENTYHITVSTQNNLDLVDKLRKKFIEEAKAVFKMTHPNIVKVHDVFEENGTAYYVMEYIDGKSLGEMVKQRGFLPEVEAVGYIRQVAEALRYVHSLNRLHLDIKPGNVMVDSQGNAILIDFGASKHYDTESGENTSTLMGVNTKGYAPVEQSTQSFSTFSPATDIYALGATLYKLLTGITPPDSTLLMADEETLHPLPEEISASTRDAVFSAMSVKRKDRPQSAEAFLEMLGNDSAPDRHAVPKAEITETCIIGAEDDESTVAGHPDSDIDSAQENQPSVVERPSGNKKTLASRLYFPLAAASCVMLVVGIGDLISTVSWYYRASDKMTPLSDISNVSLDLCLIIIFLPIFLWSCRKYLKL